MDDAGHSVLGVAVLAEHLLYGGPVPQVAVVKWHGLSCQLLNPGHHPCTRAQFTAQPGVTVMMAPAAALLRLSSTATLWPASSSLTAQWEPTYPAPPVTSTQPALVVFLNFYIYESAFTVFFDTQANAEAVVVSATHGCLYLLIQSTVGASILTKYIDPIHPLDKNG